MTGDFRIRHQLDQGREAVGAEGGFPLHGRRRQPPGQLHRGRLGGALLGDAPAEVADHRRQPLARRRVVRQQGLAKPDARFPVPVPVPGAIDHHGRAAGLKPRGHGLDAVDRTRHAVYPGEVQHPFHRPGRPWRTECRIAGVIEQPAARRRDEGHEPVRPPDGQREARDLVGCEPLCGPQQIVRPPPVVRIGQAGGIEEVRVVEERHAAAARGQRVEGSPVAHREQRIGQVCTFLRWRQVRPQVFEQGHPFHGDVTDLAEFGVRQPDQVGRHPGLGRVDELLQVLQVGDPHDFHGDAGVFGGEAVHGLRKEPLLHRAGTERVPHLHLNRARSAICKQRRAEEEQQCSVDTGLVRHRGEVGT